EELPPETEAEIERTRDEYEEQLDARYAAARGFVDAIVRPEDTRPVLDLALRAAMNNPAPHIGAFTLPDDA
ncbi:MAG: carboxyl transferase domain-containing protein, partial [Gemmatimonadota bacterium]